MLLTLVIILILIGSAVVGSLYSNFLVFYQNFTETENYHKARYASVAAVERAQLVIKQREPGYIGSGGRKLSEEGSIGPASDGIIPGTGFSYLSNSDGEKNKSTIFWEINSRTNRIPSEGNGNVEKLLATSGSSPNYNMMDYENAEIFLLHYDESEGNPYKHDDVSIQKSEIQKVTVAIRLPPHVRNKFNELSGNFYNLKATEPLIAGGYKDDALVDWQLKGTLKYGESLYAPFTIFATQNARGGGAADNDSTVRESDLNNGSGIELTFFNHRNPKSSNNDYPTIISSKDNEIKNADNQFGTIFTDSATSDLQLKFSLLNLVLGGGALAARYPFLEYYAEFTPRPGTEAILSDKYFTIKTEGNFGDYKVDTIIYKPTIVESILKSFTTIL